MFVGQPARRCRARATGSACRAASWKRGAQHGLQVLRRQRRRQPRRRRAPSRSRGTTNRCRPSVTLPPLGGGLARARMPVSRPSAPAGDGVAAYPWERPLGARPCRWRGRVPRVGAARELDSRSASAARTSTLDDAGYGVYEASSTRRAGDDYCVRPRRPARCPTRARAGSRKGSGARRGWSTRVAGPTRFAAARDARPRDLRVARRHVQRGRDVRCRRSRICPASRARHHRDRGHAGGGVPRRSAAGATTACTSRRAQSSYGGPAGLGRFVAAAHDIGLAVILDVVYNHVGASRLRDRGVRPVLHRQVRDAVGEGDQLRRHRLRPGPRMGDPERVGWIRDYGIDGLRLDAIHAIFDSSAEHIVAEVARRVHDDARRCGGDRRERPERSEGDARPRRTAAGRATPRGPTTSITRCRTLVTGERDGYYADFGTVAQLAKAWHRPYVYDGDYSASASSASARRPTTAGRAVRRLRRTTTRSATARSAIGCRPSARPLAAFCTLLSPFMPMLFMGEEYGEDAPFQFFSDHIDDEDRARPRARDGAREFAAFARVRGEEIPDPQDLATFERSKLTRAAGPGAVAAVRRPAGWRRRLPRASATRSSSTRTRAGCGSAGARSSSSCNFAARAAPRARAGGRRSCWRPQRRRRSGDGASSCRPLSGALIALSDVSGRAARSRSAPHGTAAARTSRSSPSTPSGVELCLFDDDDDETRVEMTAAHRAQLALLHPRRRARAALRLPRLRPVRAASRATGSTPPSC